MKGCEGVMTTELRYPPTPSVEDFPKVLANVLRALTLVRRGEHPPAMTRDEMVVGQWLQACEQIRLQEAK